MKKGELSTLAGYMTGSIQRQGAKNDRLRALIKKARAYDNAPDWADSKGNYLEKWQRGAVPSEAQKTRFMAQQGKKEYLKKVARQSQKLNNNK